MSAQLSDLLSIALCMAVAFNPLSAYGAPPLTPHPTEDLATPGGTPALKSLTPAELATIEDQFAELKDTMDGLFRQLGIASVKTYLREQSLEGLNLQPLRELVLRRHQGQAEKITVPIHPTSQILIDYANQELRHSGIDFIEFLPEYDPSLPTLEEPLSEQKNIYETWRKVGRRVLPLIGFAAVLAEKGLFSGIGDMGSAIPSLAVAFTVYGLEWQFRHWSSKWEKLWKRSEQLNLKIPQLSIAENRWQNQLKNRGNQLIGLVNKALNYSVNSVRLGHVNNYLVNWAYPMTLYAVKFLAVTGVNWWTNGALPALEISQVTAGLYQIIADSFIINLGFFSSFGLYQVAIGQLAGRGEISETLRLQLESVAVSWNTFWRAISVLPGLLALGVGMQLSWGLIFTLPLLMHLAHSTVYSLKTAELFKQNSNLLKILNPRAARGAQCQEPLLRHSRDILLHRRKTFTELVRTLLGKLK